LTSKWQGGVAGSGVFTNMINGPLVSGATTTTLTLNSVDFPDAGDYRYIVSNVGGSATSSVVSLTVLATSPAQDFTLDFPGAPVQQVAGNDWNTLSQWNPGGQAGDTTAYAQPGSHYHVVGGARLRSPVGAANTNFSGGAITPGIQAIVEGTGVWINSPDATYATNGAPMGELRFKHANPGTKLLQATGHERRPD